MPGACRSACSKLRSRRPGAGSATSPDEKATFQLVLNLASARVLVAGADRAMFIDRTLGESSATRKQWRNSS